MTEFMVALTTPTAIRTVTPRIIGEDRFGRKSAFGVLQIGPSAPDRIIASAGHLAAAAGRVPVPNDSGRRSGNPHQPGRFFSGCYGTCSICLHQPA